MKIITEIVHNCASLSECQAGSGRLKRKAGMRVNTVIQDWKEMLLPIKPPLYEIGSASFAGIKLRNCGAEPPPPSPPPQPPHS